MRLLDRYLLRELLIPLGYILGGLLIVWDAFSLFNDLTKFQEKHLVFTDVLELYIVRVPATLVLLVPSSSCSRCSTPSPTMPATTS